MIRGIHHVAILTSNIERAMDFFRQTFGCEPVKIVSVNKPGLKLRTAMLSLGASHLQLIEPEIGPGVEQLKKAGEGTIFEMALEVNDIEEFYDHVKGQGITPVSLTGEPIQSKFLTASSGNRYFYLPQQKPQGTNIEIYQVVSNKPQTY